jgi:hypothetical protein
MNAPERIYVCLDDNEDGCCPVESIETPEEDFGRFLRKEEATEYVRADIFAALTAEVKALRKRESEAWEIMEQFVGAAEEADEYEYDDDNQAPVDCGQCRAVRAYLAKVQP